MRQSDKFLNSLKTTGKRYYVSDPDCRGLSVQVGTNGELTFYAKLNIKGKHTRHFIGKYPDINLLEARKKLNEIREKTKKVNKPSDCPRTVDDLIQDYYKKKLCATCKPDNAYGAYRKLKLHVSPTLGKIKLNRLTSSDIIALIDDRIEQDEINNRNLAFPVRSLLENMIKWAVARQYITDPIMYGLTAEHFGLSKKVKDRFLSMDEIKTFFTSIDNLPKGSRVSKECVIGLKLLTLLGIRRGDLTYAEWNNVDLDNAYWHIPKQASKSGKHGKGKSINVPLSSWAIKLFKELKELTGHSQYVMQGFKIVNGIREDWHVNKDFFTHALRDMLQDGTLKMEHWCLHDLRRTFASHMENIADTSIVDLCLGHNKDKAQKISGAARHYFHGDQFEKRKEVLQTWSDIVYDEVYQNSKVIHLEKIV